MNSSAARGSTWTTASLRDDWWITVYYVRSENGPWGLDGGLDGTTNYIRVVRTDGRDERYRSCTALPLGRGDVVKVVTATGGGYGDPRRRPRGKSYRRSEK